MSVVSVRARSFILALFIRDDGERFLLGDNGYDFMDSQLHFSANTIENDEVEKQGADGTMLAGQVRRASVQTFDGYVGDATTPKEEIEQMRRDFIAFFAKNHHFRVIYVDCNRNAWQRKGGYLVDAPEVKELWQIHPEYHVGLNFEDVNYYEYDENAEGQEILANIMKVPLSSAVEGGLVWDEDGAVSEDATVVYDGDTATASGASITVSDAVEAPLSGFQLKGETSQNGTPTPSAPVAVQTVTGENVVEICGKNIYNKDLPLSKTYYTNTGAAATYAKNQFINFTIVPISDKITISYSGIHNQQHGSSIAAYVRLVQYDASGAFISRLMSNTNGYTFNISSSTAKIIVCIDAGEDAYFDNLQLEYGNQATAYEPYQGQSYPISLGSIELCKIGTYQDYIYKSDGKWYVHKSINKEVLDGSGTWTAGGQNGAYIWRAPASDLVMPSAASVLADIVCSHLKVVTFSDIYYARDTGIAIPGNGQRICISTMTDVATTKAWLDANTPSVYYALATPTDTEITNAALVAQLEAILSQGKTYAGTNNITTVITAGNEQGELEITYYTSYEAKVVGGGYVWEEGGSGGPTVIVNESISAVSPVWTVYGPALNPQLENATNGDVIEYVGLIADGQTLVIDMGEQTAKLDGLNVISNVTGDFISLESGANTLLYSAGNDAPESEIGWSEIVG